MKFEEVKGMVTQINFPFERNFQTAEVEVDQELNMA
jgi:hypothetical protein